MAAARQRQKRHPTAEGRSQEKSRSAAMALCAALMDLIGNAAVLGSPQRLEEWARKLALPTDRSASSPDLMAAVAELAIDFTLFTAPPGRTTAIDRLARMNPVKPGTIDAEALAALKANRFALFEVGAPHPDGHQDARDLLTGISFPLVTMSGEPIADHQVRLAGRLAATPTLAVLVSSYAVVDDQTLAAIRPWLSRDGRSMANPVRCAEVIYRQAIARRQVFLPSPNNRGGSTTDDGEPTLLSVDAGKETFHEIARAWAALPPGGTPTAESEAWVRSRIGTQDLIYSIQWVRAGRESARKPTLTAAYERIAILQLETLHRRANLGHASAVASLAEFEHEIERAIRGGEIPSLYHDLFQELNRRARPIGCGSGSGPAAGKPGTARAQAGDAELDKLRQRLQALRAKTVDQGCTEEEALAAAAKVAELLDRYGLSLSELEMRQQSCEGVGIALGRRRRAPIDQCIGTIGSFCDCRYWLETAADQERRIVYFGLPADAAAARYLYELIESAIDRETRQFKAGPVYSEHPSTYRASATRSFQVGMVESILRKLQTLKAERSATTVASSGRDLVPVKTDIVAEELAKLGMRFTSKATPRSQRVLSDAYQAGRVAGETFEVHRSVTAMD